MSEKVDPNVSEEVNGRVLNPPNPNEFEGPTSNRSCRDVIFLILFIAFVVGAIVFLVFLALKADPKRLIHGNDQYGNVCGRKNTPYEGVPLSGQDFSQKPYMGMGNVINLASAIATGQASNGATCISKCSNSSTQIAFRCIPVRLDVASNKTEEITRAIFGVSAGNFFRDVGKDLAASWREIVYMCLIGLAFAIIITAMLRFLAGFVVWLTVAIIILGSIAATIYLWVSWHFRSKEVEKMQKDTSGKYSDYEKELMKKQLTGFLVGAIVVSIFTVLTILLLIAMRKRIKLVIALFKEAGKAIASMPLLLLQPVWTCIWLVVICGAFVYGVFFIEASGVPQRVGQTIHFVIPDLILGMRWYHLFAFFWVSQFVLHCQDLTIAGAVALWYFARDKKKLGWPIATSMKRMYLYHLGSIAIGSLIIAIMKMIRFLLKKFEKRLGGANPVCGFLLKCCQCCLWCFEKFLKYLSRNAYIEIAIYGYSFCKAAQKAFNVIVSNAFRIMAINYIGSFVLFLAKVAVVVPTVFIGIEIMKTLNGVVTYAWVPVLLAGLFTFFIAHCFISVYEMTIDALFICFCEDCEMNDGLQKPYFMSKGLMKLVENSKKAIEALEVREKEQQQQAWTTNVVQPNNVYGIPVAQPPPQRPPGYVHGGMTPLHPAYPANSIPPSPSHFLTPPGQ
ncbi:choline transporter-like protein 1 isoform X2 [Macrobrachium nipponense]|uniref:choline transporter-like protein 1 isoform X2 n=1 Tax=Macrobrachium nipponense TaxID=159736 RepID=UPI0030C8190F